MNNSIAPDTGSQRLYPLLVGLLLVFLAAVLAHMPILHNDFISFDDGLYVNNERIGQGLTPENIRWALTAEVVANWHPVTVYSHLLDGTLFGLNASGHHGVSLILHGVNCCLLALVLFRMTSRLVPSLLVGALYAVHPVHVESVAWASSRKDILSIFFLMLTFLAYHRWVTTRRLRDYGLTMLAYAFALLSKPTVVTLPCVLLLLDFWPLNRAGVPEGEGFVRAVRAYVQRLPGLALEKLPFLGLALLASGITFVVQRSANAVAPTGNLPLLARLLNAVHAYARYLATLIWPTDLALLYPHPTWWPWHQVAVSGLVLVSVTALLIWGARRFDARYLIVGWLWFLGVLVPMIGVVQVGSQSMADRYAYPSFIGLYILVVWALSDVVKGLRLPARLVGAVVAVVLLALGWQTHSYAKVWIDSETLYSHAVRVTKHNGSMHFNLANELVRQGRHAEAIPHFEAAIIAEPVWGGAHGNYGTALLNLGRIDEAMAMYEKALTLDESLIEPRLNAGLILSLRGEHDRAARVYTRLIQDRPDIPEAYFRLAQVIERRPVGTDPGTDPEREQGALQAQAHALYLKALELDPAFAEAHNSLGRLLAQRGDLEGAVRHFAQAAALRPDMTDAQLNLARARQLLEAMRGEPSGNPVPERGADGR